MRVPLGCTIRKQGVIISVVASSPSLKPNAAAPTPVILPQSNTYSRSDGGGGGFLCCWARALTKGTAASAASAAPGRKMRMVCINVVRVNMRQAYHRARAAADGGGNEG